MVVQAVRSEPVSGGWEADFPVKQGKNRECLLRGMRAREYQGFNLKFSSFSNLVF
jgi:hypothetical protein